MPKGMPSDLLSLHRRPSAIGQRRDDLGPVAPAPGTPALAVAPWAVEMPPDGLEFNGDANVSPGAGPVTVIPAGLLVTLQRGYVGVIKDVSFVVNNMLATTNVRFALRFNGSPVQGWDNMTVLPRIAASASNTYDRLVIRIPDGARVDWAITVVDAGVYQLGVQYHGWSVSKRTADRYGSW